MTQFSSAGQSLWDEISTAYMLRIDEKAVLARACKTADRLDELETAHAELGRPFLTRGSMGQDVIHPLIAEMRVHEAHLSKQLASLKLPDTPGGEKPNQQRSAAQTRWAQAHGASA